MIKYPVGQQHFESIRENGFIYVDKTSLIYNLSQNYKYVFLARPRRFGKSLLISTLKAYFEGKKDLFKGLAIESLEKEWTKYPVFTISLARVNSGSHESLKELLNQQFSEYEKKLEIENTNPDFGSRFSTIIIEAYRQTGQRVVVLVDEYDNPLINTLSEEKEDIHEQNRELLKSVYSNLKDMDEYIRFGMLTGVSRFSKMTVFSGLNNLYDITFLNKFSSICGITKDELKDYLGEGVVDLSLELGITPEETLKELAKWYDGYHFSEKCPDLYNPFSLLSALASQKIYDYWFETATPGFLVERMKVDSANFSKIFQDKVFEKSLAAVDTSFSSPVPLLYQTGYLTIKDYDPITKLYKVGVPNLEVENSLFPCLISYYTKETQEDIVSLAHDLKSCLVTKNLDSFFRILESFYASIPYDIIPAVNEKYFQNTLYLLCRTMPVDVEGEKRTSDGRVDLVVRTDNFIYIFEFKVEESTQGALNQIEGKEYALAFKNEGKEIIKIGLNFSREKRRLLNWQIK